MSKKQAQNNYCTTLLAVAISETILAHIFRLLIYPRLYLAPAGAIKKCWSTWIDLKLRFLPYLAISIMPPTDPPYTSVEILVLGHGTKPSKKQNWSVSVVPPHHCHVTTLDLIFSACDLSCVREDRNWNLSMDFL
jgi:hypothetical protein